MPVVQNTVTDPTGAPIPNVQVVVICVGNAGQPVYDGATVIEGPKTTSTDASGTWTMTLPGNSALTPANTYYQAVETHPVTRQAYVSTFVMPASGGPYNLSSILSTPPPTPSAPGITGVEIAAAGTIAGTRPEINLVGGTNVTVSATDNPTANRVDVTVNSTAGGSTPADTVVTETGYGQTSTAGTSALYSRGDHTHGSPSLTSAAPTNSAVGDTAAVGTATTPAKADHIHGRETFGVVSAQTSYGAASGSGTATTVSHSDHAHGTPALTSAAPTTSAVGDAAAVGTGTTPARTDHVHGREAFGAVTTQTSYGQASTNGVAATVARSDHAHGTPAGAAVDDPMILGLGVWTASPWLATNAFNLSAGTLVFVLIRPQQSFTCTNLGLWVTSAATGPSTGTNGMALYTEAGVLLSATGDMSTAFTSIGYAEGTLTASQALTAGTNYYIAAMTHMTGTPQVAATNSVGNIPVIQGHYSSVYLTSQSTFPANFTPSTANLNNAAYFLAGR